MHDTNPEFIEREKKLAKKHKQDIINKYFDRHKQYPDKEIILKLSDPILKTIWNFKYIYIYIYNHIYIK